jgi:hypothetical protein
MTLAMILYSTDALDVPLSVLNPPAVYQKVSTGHMPAETLLSYPFIARWPAAEASELTRIKTQLREFTTLPMNWDGYGAQKISQEACNTIDSLMDMIQRYSMSLPSVTPKVAGTVAVEWQTSLGDAYLEIGKTRYSGYIEGKDSEPTFLEGNVDAISPELVATISFALYPENNTSDPVSSIVATSSASDQLAA